MTTPPVESQHVILFTGPAGAGVASAICRISDLVTVDAEERLLWSPADAGFAVDLDYGELLLGTNDSLRLYDLEGPQHSGATQSELEYRALGLVVLVPADASDPARAVLERLEAFGAITRRGGAIVGVTRASGAGRRALGEIRKAVHDHHPFQVVPVLTVDTDDADDMATLLLSLVTNVEMNEHFPSLQQR